MLDCESGSGNVSRKHSTETRASSPSRALSKLINLDFPAGRRLSQFLPPKSAPTLNSQNQGKRSMSSRLSAGQMSFRRLSNSKKGTGPVASGRSLLAGTFKARFGHDHDDQGSTPLITKLDKYSTDELKEYRQVFNMFDTDRSGAIGLDELENAIRNLGMDPQQVDLESVIKEADKRGNHQIDFDEFCEVMKTMSEKSRSWNEVIKECFTVFDRSESGLISKKDFEFILHDLGGMDNPILLDELFTEFDVDSDGFIDYDEFGFLVKNYLTDEDVF